MEAIKKLLYLCDLNSKFKEIPSWFEGDWNPIRLSENAELNPDIHCSLEDLNLLSEQFYHAIWMPNGLNTFSEQECENFLNQVYRLLLNNGIFWLSTLNIKEVARLAYQTGWNEPVQPVGLTPKQLLFGTEQQKANPHQRGLIKNGFTMKDLATILEKAKFGKIEIYDQGLTFLVRAHKLPLLPDQKCQIAVQEFDINAQIAQRDKIDQSTSLPIHYQAPK